jgi:hypothetical protein
LRRQDVEDEPPRRSRSVDSIGDRTQPDPLLVEVGRQIDQPLHGAAEAVQLPHDQHVTRSRIGNRFGEARTIHFRAAGLVGIEPLAAGLLQCLDLGRQILVGRRHPRITDQHAIFPKLIDNGPATELLTEMGFEKCALLTTSNGIGRSRSRAAVFP